MSRAKALIAAVVALGALGVSEAPAQAQTPAQIEAQDTGRFTILEENDSIYFNSDKHYTQGLRLSYLFPTVGPTSAWNGPFGFFGSFLPIFRDEPGRIRRYSMSFGQNLYTPKDINRNPPDPRDRPYAGWAYLGLNLMQENHGSQLENFELQLGAIGPGALGKQTQNTFHGLIGAGNANGWGNQLQNEPGILVSYDRSFRIPIIGDNTGLDIVPEAGLTLGNVFTYGEAGLLLRIGTNLKADYGPVRIRPGLSGSDYFNPAAMDGNLGFYVFAGVQGRAVAHNVFLDGNTFRQSPHVSREPFVGDMEAGFSVFWANSLKLDFMALRRTIEFAGQSHPDILGTAAITFGW